jgi:predicted GNAT family acetyltransferase
MHTGRLREVSGVATHPDRQGRGLARALMERLLQEEIARGEIPFLHVMRSNELARSLYRRMGFREHQELTVRRIARNG